MTFLAPIAGLIAAAVATPLLILLYFLKLRRRPVRISSTLLWTRAVEDLQVNTPFRILRPSFLLFLQLAALACLLLAFARPAIQSEGAGVSRMIILIDTSASMAAPSQEDSLSRLEYAKRDAADAITRFSRSADDSFECMIITFAARARIVSTYSGDTTLLDRAIDSIEQTDQAGDIGAALKLIEAQLARFDESASAQQTRILLFSDGDVQNGAARARAGFANADFQFIRTGPEPGAPLENSGIVALSARRDLEDPGLLRIFARVLNTRTEPRTAALSYTFQGERRGGLTVEVPAASPDGPGLAPIAFDLREMRAGALTLALVTDDQLESDDAASAILQPPAQSRVLIVIPDDASRSQLAYALLERVVEITTTIPPIVYTQSDYQRRLEAAAIAEHDMLIFHGAAPQQQPDLPALYLGVAPPDSRVTLLRNEDDAADQRFSAWLRRHPLLRNVNLDSVFTEGATRITVATSDDDDDDAAQTTELAWGAEGPLIIEQEHNGLRRVITAFTLEESNWPLLPSFVVFTANLIERLSPRAEAIAGAIHTTSDVISARATPGQRQFTLIGPGDYERTLTPTAASRITFGPLARAGLYTLDPPAENAQEFAVNLLSERESSIAVRPRVDIAGRDIQSAGIEESAPREIWHWFVIAALILLTIEWIAFAWRMRI